MPTSIITRLSVSAGILFYFFLFFVSHFTLLLSEQKGVSHQPQAQGGRHVKNSLPPRVGGSPLPEKCPVVCNPQKDEGDDHENPSVAHHPDAQGQASQAQTGQDQGKLSGEKSYR